MACGRKEARLPASPPAAPNSGATQEASDRAELVLPSPEFWRPESAGRKIKLTLIAEKTTIRAGEKFRYRLEVQNVGEKDIFFHEDPSFIKVGEEAWHGHYRILVKFPDGHESPLRPVTFHFDALPKPAELNFADMTDTEIDAALEKIDARKRTRKTLELYLHPGETLFTRPDPTLPGSFRDLRIFTDLERPGRYRIRVVYDVKAPDPLHAESNTIELEVVQ